MSNGIKVNAGFDVGSANPIDSRMILTTSEMLHADTNIIPNGQLSVNSEDHFLYIFNPNGTYSETTGYFKKYTSDGGKSQWYGTESEYQALPVETQSDTSIVFYRYGSDSEKNYVVSDHSIKQEVYMSESDYQELETKDSNTVYLTPGHVRKGEDTIVDASEITSKSRREIILIGDSYGVDYNNTSTGGSWTGWQTQFATLNPQWTVHKGATGGAGFSIAAEGRNFLQTLQHLCETETISGTDVTDIVVLGGYNDMSATASLVKDITTIANYLQSYVNEFVAWCRSHFPYAKITLGCLAVDYNNADLNSRCEFISQAYNLCAQRANISYYRNFKFILLQKADIFFVDGDANSGFHPSTAGNKEVAVYLAQYIANGCFDVRKGIVQNGAQVCVTNGEVNIMPNTYTSGYANQCFLCNELTALGTIPYNTLTKVCDLGNQDGDNLLWGAGAGYPKIILQVFNHDNSKPTTLYSNLQIYIINKAAYVLIEDNISGVDLVNNTCVISCPNPIIFDYQVMY